MDEKLDFLRLSIEVVVFSLVKEQLCILMQYRDNAPFGQGWALPQAQIDAQADNNLEQTAKRHIKDLLNVEAPYLEQVQTIGNNTRDPRGWSVSVLYYSLIYSQDIIAAQDKHKLKWMTVKEALSTQLSLDHQQLIENCYHRLQNKSLYTSLPIFLLAEEFTLTELQKTYELVLGIKMEKKSFRRRLLDAGFLQDTGHFKHANHRPASLYQLKERQPYYFARIIEGVRDSKNMD